MKKKKKLKVFIKVIFDKIKALFKVNKEVVFEDEDIGATEPEVPQEEGK